MTHMYKIVLATLFHHFSKSIAIISTNRKTSSIAIVGGGLSGLASAYNLAKHGKEITVYDASKPGEGGASSVSAGLIHPFAPRGNLIWQGLEGFAASMKIIQEVGASESNLIFNSNVKLVRMIETASDFKNWQRAAQIYPDWLTFISCGENSSAKVIIEMAGVVDCPRYMRALWELIAMTNKLVCWRIEAVQDPVELCKQYDVVILCCGASIPQLFENSVAVHNDQQSLKTQRSEPDLREALICGDYVVPKTFNNDRNEFGINFDRIGEQYLLGGATHEYLDDYDLRRDDLPDLAVASGLLLSQLEKLQPLLGDRYDAVAANAGVRVVTPRTHFGKLPMAGRAAGGPHNLWLLGGFGSRGLIHHALVAKMLTDAILQDDEDLIPLCLRPPLK